MKETKENMKNKQITINKTEWNKILKLVGKVYDRADQLYNSFAGVDKIYKELGRYAEELKGKINEIDENKKELENVNKQLEHYERK